MEGYTSGLSPAIMAAQRDYEAARKRDEINRSLQRRVDRDTLVTRNVIKDDHMAASQRNQLNALRRSMLEDKLKKVSGCRDEGIF